MPKSKISKIPHAAVLSARYNPVDVPARVTRSTKYVVSQSYLLPPTVIDITVSTKDKRTRLAPQISPLPAVFSAPNHSPTPAQPTSSGFSFPDAQSRQPSSPKVVPNPYKIAAQSSVFNIQQSSHSVQSTQSNSSQQSNDSGYGSQTMDFDSGYGSQTLDIDTQYGSREPVKEWGEFVTPSGVHI
ncbi:hypothetical protein BGX27_001900, partial [Mortierella sp. AM989]